MQGGLCPLVRPDEIALRKLSGGTAQLRGCAP